jgi:Predicted Fe-S oxidoreductase
VSTVCDILEILPPEMVIQRLTSDGYRDKYLAPQWGINKMDVLNSIDKEMGRRDSYQGLLWERFTEKNEHRTSNVQHRILNGKR